MALTKRQKQVLDFIAGFIDENGYCPSYEEIAGGLGLASLATVHKHISVLEAKNYLKRGFNQSRSLELAPKYVQDQRRTKPPALEIPLLGRIAAGAPVESVEQQEMLNFADFAGGGNTFALEVRGNSMIDDHICDGDLHPAGASRRGHATAISWWRWWRDTKPPSSGCTAKAGDMVRLQPANSAVKPILVPARDVQVQGRLLAVLRKYK
jgi:repressor LexA